jgi:hypothetical protein
MYERLTAKRGPHIMAEDKGKPPGSQLIPRALRDFKRSPIWQHQQKAFAKLRESLPSPQMPERLKTPRLPGDPAIDAIAERVRAETSWELEPEPEQVPAQAIKQLTEQTTAQAPEQVAEKPVAETLAALEAAPKERIEPKTWRDNWVKNNPRRKKETARAYAARMREAMEKAPVTRLWTEEGCRRSLYNRPVETDFAPDPGSVQTPPKRR